jgi:hypothetical protein
LRLHADSTILGRDGEVVMNNPLTQDQGRDAGRFKRGPASASVLLLVVLGTALIGTGLLMSTRLGPLVSLGDGVLTILAYCF